MGRRATIYDVARVAGVSASTVSRAFARPGRVNAETAATIFAAAESLDYRATVLPGLTAQRTTARTRTLALVVADITNPFYAEIIRGAHEAAGELGYAIMLAHTQEDAQIERAWTERELSAVEGVILASSRMSDSAIRMMAKQKPVMVLNRRLPEVPSLLVDNPRGGRRAMEHLGELGHRDITYLAGPETSWTDGIRWQSIREAAYELELRVHRVGPCNSPTMQAGFTRAREVRKHGSTAVLAYNDVLAIGVIKGLRRRGVDVPADVSVMGFDNILLAEVVEPELTTVAAPLHALGATGVKNLVAMIGGAVPRGEPLLLPVKLVVRASTAPPPGLAASSGPAPAQPSVPSTAGSRPSASAPPPDDDPGARSR